MKLSTLAHVAILALIGAAAARADTVYYSPRGGGIEAVTGKIVEEDEDHVKVLTKNGKTVSISADDVYQIIRDRLPEPKPAPVAPPPAPVAPPPATVPQPATTVVPQAEPVAPPPAAARSRPHAGRVASPPAR